MLVTSATKVGRVGRGAYVVPIAGDARRIGDVRKVGRVGRGAYVVPIAGDARRIGDDSVAKDAYSLS